MRILCRHGFYSFYPEYSSEIADFQRHFEISLVREEDYYTFPELQGLQKYALATAIYKDIPATVTIAGNPWDIMRENEQVFSIALKKLVPLAAITSMVTLSLSDGFFDVNVPLIQAGSLVSTGDRIVDYDAIFVEEYQQLKVIGVGYA